MKKVFMVLMMVSISAIALADISLSGLVSTGVTLVEGTSDKDDGFGANALLFGRVQVRAQNEDGTFGGLVRLRASLNSNVDCVYSWAWWKPLDIVRLQIGFIDSFAVCNIVGWDFNSNDSEDNNIASAGYSYSEYRELHRATGFYNGTWWTGAALSLTPLKGLALNLAVPLEGLLDDGEEHKAADVYRGTHAQAVYTIEGVGRAALTFKGRDDLYIDYIRGDASTLYGSFFLFALENMGFNVGVAYTFPIKINENGTKGTYSAPVATGLGFSYGFGDFLLRARFAATFAGSFEADGVRTGDPFRLGFGVIPSYDFGILKLHLNTGILFVNDSYAFGWHVNPYITKTAGPGTFYASVRVESFGAKGDGNPKIHWGIPIAMQFEL